MLAASAALRADIDGVAFPFASTAWMGGSIGGVVLFRATAAGRRHKASPVERFLRLSTGLPAGT
jgi:hypothetical protein